MLRLYSPLRSLEYVFVWTRVRRMHKTINLRSTRTPPTVLPHASPPHSLNLLPARTMATIDESRYTQSKRLTSQLSARHVNRNNLASQMAKQDKNDLKRIIRKIDVNSSW